MVQNSAEHFGSARCCGSAAISLIDLLSGSTSPAVFEEYLRTFRQPDTIHAIREDYRAAAPKRTSRHDKAEFMAMFADVRCVVVLVRGGLSHRMHDVLQAGRSAVQAEGGALASTWANTSPEQDAVVN